MFVLTVLPVFLAASSSAMPTLSTHQSGPCTGLGQDAYDTASDFTLTAYNLTLPNANTTGAPLVLGSGPAGTSGQASVAVLVTYASYSRNDWPGPNMTLASGALTPAPEGGLVASNTNVTAGDAVSFIVTDPQFSSPGPQIYCAVPQTDESDLEWVALAVNGDTQDFSLCTTVDGSAQDNVIYHATVDNGGQYDYDSCYSIRVQLVGN
ncbi:hypothetical protein AcV7_004817 [Taiwanofungus camphoratus]|nr:hypothetical protein AcV7_004817 [Antrodia cinnamomea]